MWGPHSWEVSWVELRLPKTYVQVSGPGLSVQPCLDRGLLQRPASANTSLQSVGDCLDYFFDMGESSCRWHHSRVDSQGVWDPLNEEIELISDRHVCIHSLPALDIVMVYICLDQGIALLEGVALLE